MLGNIVYSNPTKLYFGKESLSYLRDELEHYGKNVLLIYGSGSIKKTGLYDKVMSILKEKNKNVIELSGVMPNPTLEKLEEGASLARENNIDFILAVGGGSVCDYSKALSASVHCKEDIWEKYFIKKEDVACSVIPIGTILTMTGTGSEMNGTAVITNTKTMIKKGRTFPDFLFPKFSILNPEFTYTVSEYQMTAGIFDIMSHILEQYFSGTDDNTSDYIMEGLLRSLIKSSLIAIKEPTNYEARSNIMWTATWALNTLVAKGKSTDWMVHMFGHAVSAHTDATHGMTLSAISQAYYHHILPYAVDKFARFALNVWNVTADNKSKEEIAREGLKEMKKWMQEMKLVLSIKELGVSEDMIEELAKGIVSLNGGYKELTRDEVIQILKMSL